MKIYEAYDRIKLEEHFKNPQNVREFLNEFENELIEENSERLKEMLSDATWEVFAKFQLHPSEKKYFIGGSAILYIFPKLVEFLDLKRNVGDLDIIIPYREYWEKAGLGEEYDKNGIFRAESENGEIEVFNIWAPDRAGVEYADVSVRSTEEILKDAKFIDGYWYMSIMDVLDYKMKLHRDKEIKASNILIDYAIGKIVDKGEFLYKLAKAIGIRNTAEYVHMTNHKEMKKAAQKIRNNLSNALSGG